MNQVFESFEKLEKTQKAYFQQKNQILKDLGESIGSANVTQLPALAKEVKQLTTKLTDAGKDYYTYIGKYSKAVDKKLKLDLDNVWDPQQVEGKERELCEIIIQHFIRQGRFDLAMSLAQEAHLDLNPELHSAYKDMYYIQEALRHEDADLAIKWSTNHSAFLDQAGSVLEFKLHQLKFLLLVKKGQIKDALAYSQAHFYKFKDTEMKTIQKLMCVILYAKRLGNCPYSAFFDPLMWQSIQTLFSREFSRYLGESFESPLYTSVTVGSTALPMIMKISSLMKDKAVEWTQTRELPVTIPLLDSQRYHSIFICPVTKEHATDQNPPMLLVCGHVISKETLTRLSKGSLNSRFKCPYCPGESTASQAVRVYF